MSLLAKYHWTNPQLRARYKAYSWLMMLSILGVAASMYFWGSAAGALVGFGVACVFWLLSVRVQNEDKRQRAAKLRAKAKAQQNAPVAS